MGKSRRVILGILFGGLVFAAGIGLGRYCCSTNREQEIPEKYYLSEEDHVPVDSLSDNRITSNTEFVVQKKSLNDGKVTRSQESLPSCYIGLSRGELVCKLKEQDCRKTDFVKTVSLVSFSKDRVVVEESDYYPQGEQSFFLTVYDHKLVVLYADRKTVYMETDIYLEDLPEEMYYSFIEGYEISSRQELYDVLETLSS